jgi:hypothetical protein
MVVAKTLRKKKETLVAAIMIRKEQTDKVKSLTTPTIFCSL